MLISIYLLYVSDPIGPRNDATTSNKVHNLLHFAHLFGMDAIRSDLIRHLSLTWPSTLEAWDLNEMSIKRALHIQDRLEREEDEAMENDSSASVVSGSDDDIEATAVNDTDASNPASESSSVSFDLHGGSTLRDSRRERKPVDLPDPVSLILLNRKTPLPSLLPSAFYALSRISWDRTRQTNYPLTSARLTDQGVSYGALLNGSDGYTEGGRDVLRVILGREKLIEQVKLFALFSPLGMGTVESGCLRPSSSSAHPDHDHDDFNNNNSPNTCQTSVSLFWCTRVQQQMLASGTNDPLTAMHILSNERLFPTFDVCLGCEIEVGRRIRKARMGIWGCLSGIFELWNDL